MRDRSGNHIILEYYFRFYLGCVSIYNAVTAEKKKRNECSCQKYSVLYNILYLKRVNREYSRNGYTPLEAHRLFSFIHRLEPKVLESNPCLTLYLYPPPDSIHSVCTQIGTPGKFGSRYFRIIDLALVTINVHQYVIQGDDQFKCKHLKVGSY